MRNIKYILVLIALSAILFECKFNPYYSSCRNGYYYSSDKDYGVDDICYEYAKNPDKDTIIAFHDTLGNIVNDTINTYYTATLVIGRHVERFEYNDSVLVVKQKPKDKFYEEDTLYYLDEYNRFKAFDYHEYWIIKTNTNDVYGPLSLNQYHNYCMKLDVPEKFRILFDDVEPTFLTQMGNIVSVVLTVLLAILFDLLLLAILCSPFVILFIVIRKIRRRKKLKTQ